MDKDNDNELEKDNKSLRIVVYYENGDEVDFSFINHAGLYKSLDEMLRANIEAREELKQKQSDVNKADRITGRRDLNIDDISEKLRNCDINTPLSSCLKNEELNRFRLYLSKPISTYNIGNREPLSVLTQFDIKTTNEYISKVSEKEISPFIKNRKFSVESLKSELRTMYKAHQDKYLRDLRYLLKYYKNPPTNLDNFEKEINEILLQLKNIRTKKQPVKDLKLLVAFFGEMKRNGILLESMNEIATMINDNWFTYKSQKTIKKWLEQEVSNIGYKIDIKKVE